MGSLDEVLVEFVEKERDMTHDVVSVVPLASSRCITLSVRRYPRLGGSGPNVLS